MSRAVKVTCARPLITSVRAGVLRAAKADVELRHPHRRIACVA